MPTVAELEKDVLGAGARRVVTLYMQRAPDGHWRSMSLIDSSAIADTVSGSDEGTSSMVARLLEDTARAFASLYGGHLDAETCVAAAAQLLDVAALRTRERGIVEGTKNFEYAPAEPRE